MTNHQPIIYLARRSLKYSMISTYHCTDGSLSYHYESIYEHIKLYNILPDDSSSYPQRQVRQTAIGISSHVCSSTVENHTNKCEYLKKRLVWIGLFTWNLSIYIMVYGTAYKVAGWISYLYNFNSKEFVKTLYIK